MSKASRNRQKPVVVRRRGVSNLTLSLILIGVVVIAVAIMFVISRNTGAEAPTDRAGTAAVAVRADSNRLSTAPGSTVDFVEFLDFECEACGAVFPAVEQLRTQYGDRVNFVIRYFPISSHFNSMRAAQAVESAAQQGKLEEMYKLMYETQTEWSEQQVPKDDLFRSYAQQIGLDMARYDATYSDPATQARIEADRQDGLTLGVEGTPTFFINGEKIQPRSMDDLTGALDAALAGQ